MRSIEEQAEHMLRIMTVDMSIDFWQTKQCAIQACKEIIDAIKETADEEIITVYIIYWEKVIKTIESK
jgi:hypothetical protein